MTNATIFSGENDNPPANQPAATTDGSLFTALVGASGALVDVCGRWSCVLSVESWQQHWAADCSITQMWILLSLM